jgi:hypothetical protein
MVWEASGRLNGRAIAAANATPLRYCEIITDIPIQDAKFENMMR